MDTSSNRKYEGASLDNDVRFTHPRILLLLVAISPGSGLSMKRITPHTRGDNWNAYAVAFTSISPYMFMA
jgi:hypothetical protein